MMMRSTLITLELINFDMAYDQTLDQVKELEARGAELARRCNWAGQDIFAIAYHALTEANFHTEAAKLAETFADEMSV